MPALSTARSRKPPSELVIIDLVAANHRHCEQSEAIHLVACRGMDCFVAGAPRNDKATLLPRHLGAADGLAIERLVLMHLHGDARELSREFERRLIMGHRTAAVTADVEPGP